MQDCPEAKMPVRKWRPRVACCACQLSPQVLCELIACHVLDSIYTYSTRCSMSVTLAATDRVAVIRMSRPERRNAVDAHTAKELADAFRSFDANERLDVAVFAGGDDVFCAGADLKAIVAGDPIFVSAQGDSPMGPPRLRLSNPVLAALEGPAVAGGLEFILWC